MKKQLLQTAFLLVFGFMLSGAVHAQNQLLIPNTLSGTNFTLNLQNGQYQFYSGVNTTTMGANGNILGPTLIMKKGDFVDIKVKNQLGDTTTIHWHGMHVSAANDGGPHTTIAPGAVWNPKFTVMDKAATYWYHPHLHTHTNEQVSMGIAGLIIVRDNEEAALNLPRTYGVDDFPLVIQTKDFDDNKQIVVPSNSDDVAMVNATIDAYVDVPQQVVRFRLLNGSSQRVFNVGLSDNRTFYQIASDGGLLSEPLSLTRLQLAPGERAEILIDFSGLQGKAVELKSYASEFPNGIYGATNPGMNTSMVLNGYKPNPLNGSDFNLVSFRVGATGSQPVTTIPATLVNVSPIPESDATVTRDLTFSPQTRGMDQLNGKFLINDVSFDMNVINYTIQLNNVEIWTLENNSAIAHPFHIHDVQFYILDRDGNAPPASEQGRKDVVLVKPQETVRFITVFEDFADDTVPYMYHCHMLSHEDQGMMGQFNVVSRVTGVNDHFAENTRLSVFPNPVQGDFLTVKASSVGETILSYALYSLTGEKLLQQKTNLTGELKLNVSNIPEGLYFIKIQTTTGQDVRKIIIN